MTRVSLKRLGLLSIVLIAALMLGILSTQAVRGSDPDWAPDSDMMARGPIADRTTVARSMAEKTALAQDEEANLQAARNGPPGSKDPNYRPLPSTPVPVPTGILDNFSLPSGWGSVYRIKSVWQQFVNGDRVTVYAGSIADDPVRGRWDTSEQGVINVMVFPSGADASPTSAAYLSPTRSGALVITSAQGTVLTLTTADGSATFTFDVSTRTWITGK
jgi:hypothetical protein